MHRPTVIPTLLLFLAASPFSAFADPPDPTRTGEIADLKAVGEDLEIELAWDPDAALPASAVVRLETTAGALVGSETLVPTSSGNTVTLPRALANVRQDGWFYRAVLEAGSGEPLGALPFEVAYECTGARHCELTAHAGIGAPPGSLILSADMQRALDTALAHPNPDVLGSILQLRPELAGQVYTFSDRLAARAVSQPIPAGECTCFWVGVPILSPPTAHGLDDDRDPVVQRGTEGPGPAHLLKSRYDGGLFDLAHDIEGEVSGEAAASLRLRCFEIFGWRIVKISIPVPFGGSIEVEVPVPEIGNECPKPCQGVVGNFGEYHAAAVGWVDSGAFGSARGGAQDEVTYHVNGVPQFNRALRVGKEIKQEWEFKISPTVTVGPGHKVTDENGKVTTEGNVSTQFKIELAYHIDGSDGSIERRAAVHESTEVPEPAKAELKTAGMSTAGGSSDSEAEGYTANSYSLAMHGFAPCAKPRDATLWLYYSYEGRSEDLRTNLRSFFLERGLVVDP